MKEQIIHLSFKKLKEIVKDSSISLDLDLKEDDGENMIFSYAGNFFSFGSKIEVMLNPISKKKTRLTIHSKSSFALQVIDWGTNSELEDKFFEEILINI